jgi:hypothetical protein
MAALGMILLQGGDGGFGGKLEGLATYGVGAFISAVDQLLTFIEDSITTHWGTNIGTSVILSCVSFAILVHVYELMVQFVRTQRFTLEPIKAIAGKLIYVFLAFALANLFRGFYDRSQDQVMDCINKGKSAMGAVNVVAIWGDALQELRQDRRDTMIAQMGKGKTDDAASLAAADASAGLATGKPEDLEKASAMAKVWAAAKGFASDAIDKGETILDTVGAMGAVTVQMGNLFSKIVSNMVTYALVCLGIIIGYVVFVFMFAKNFLMLFVYFKIALKMYSLFIPSLIMLGCFQSTRNFAFGAIRYGVVMLMTLQLLFPAMESVFSEEHFEAAITHALQRNPIANKDYIQGTAAGDLTYATVRLDNDLSQLYGEMPSGFSNPFFWAETSVADIMWSSIAVAEVMFVMSLMASLVLKMYELVSGTLNGSWNPIHASVPKNGGEGGGGGGGGGGGAAAGASAGGGDVTQDLMQKGVNAAAGVTT